VTQWFTRAIGSDIRIHRCHVKRSMSRSWRAPVLRVLTGLVDDLLYRTLAATALRLAAELSIDSEKTAGGVRRNGRVPDLMIADDVARTYDHVVMSP